MSSDASEEEINFLKSLKFVRKRLARLLLSKLQSLRDPLHSLPVPKPASFRGGAEEEPTTQSGEHRERGRFERDVVSPVDPAGSAGRERSQPADRAGSV